ncbi:OsmC family protein [Staphylococcus borealis]|uniref:OsmC family protein n=1 Tax=Staphylococcus borealis TaxID=2742203 RepID=UPI000FEE1F1D|nr:OsmC family protein [Staphylococcus borealis]MDM7863958.1 OsmC family protein [Staphylococcus borealis]MDM7882773.1 OsmC family protein [Staphylococcus borealis]RIO89585.1 OsmC family peroxiredoxin [Staphylococcus haemolyticus]
MVKHDFKVQTQWRGGREEVGTVSGDVITEQISIPAPLGGNGTGTNPDELLVSASSSCYIISLAATLERAKFTNIQITNDSIGSALFENGKFKMATISHYPKILVTSSEKEKLENRLPKLLEVADNNCMISNAIRNNVEIQIQATIQ